MKDKEVVLVTFDNGNLTITNSNKKSFTVNLGKDFHTDLINLKKFNRLSGVLIKDTDKDYCECKIGHSLLHLHTGYSLLDGAIKAENLAELASKGKDLRISVNPKFSIVFTEYPQICACTDHGSMSGTYAFNTSLVSKDMIPITGIEAYCESIGGQKDNNHLILLCKNETGYKNLCKMVSLAELNKYKHPHISWDMLRKYHEGLVCLSACLAGEIPKAIINSDIDRAYEVSENFQDIFGEDFYLEVQNHEIKNELIVQSQLFRISRDLGIKTVCTTDSHYLKENEKRAHEVLLCISTQKTINDPTHFKFDGENYYVPSNKQFEEWFENTPESMATQAEIAMKCQFRYKKKQVSMPKFDTNGVPSKKMFEEHCLKGFKDRFQGKKIDFKKYKERLEREIGVIEKMNFETYFLIVADFINWAKSKGIAIGPGRGSAVGCLVAYCLKITDLDPIPYGLLFERFLNVERVSWPDIDVDIEDERRPEVIDYVKQKYGKDHVSRIITFGTLGARMVIRDVGRVFNIPYSVVDKIAKTIPRKPKMTLKRAREESVEFKQLCEKPEYKDIIAIAETLEGLPRNRSQHACGVIIAPEEISKFVPEVLLTDRKSGVEAWTAAFNMVELEDLGLLKMDFLGLRNMGIINKCLNRLGIKKESIPLNDPYVYEYIGSGDTDGIFQVESGGMKGLMKEMYFDVSSKLRKLESEYKCQGFDQTKEDKFTSECKKLGNECFERLIAAISLYRPGPMESIPQYIEGLKNPKKIHYDTPELKDILKSTYGCLIYQEQVQQTCRKLAGFSLGRSDLIRRAMGKKKQYIMDKEKEVFLHGNEEAVKKHLDNVVVEGCDKRGINPQAAQLIWDKMSKFASYAFNKSHAAGYAVISVQTAWLKKYHITEFWCETINSISDPDKVRKYINSAKFNNVKILPPDINLSESDYTIVGDHTIKIGLSSLKNVGKSADALLEERKKNGPFKDYRDFIDRVMPEKKIYEALVYSGALDIFEGTRRAKRAAVDNISELRKIKSKYSNMWFDVPAVKILVKNHTKEIPKLDEMDEDTILEKEYEFTGAYISSHPLDKFYLQIESIDHEDIGTLVETETIGDDEKDEEVVEESSRPVRICGLIKELENKITKKGDVMHIFKLEDKTGQIRCVAFPKISMEEADKWYENDPVVIEGIWKSDDFGISVQVNSVEKLSNIKIDNTCICVVEVDKEHLNAAISTIDSIAEENPNNPSVEISLSPNNRLFFVNKNKTGKRAVIPNKAKSTDIVRIKNDINSYGQLKKIARKVQIKRNPV